MNESQSLTRTKGQESLTHLPPSALCYPRLKVLLYTHLVIERSKPSAVMLGLR